MGVVRGGLWTYLSPRVACQKTDPGVELRILRSPPGLDPGKPGGLGLGVEARLLEGLAPGAGDEILARLQHAAGVLPEPYRRLAAPQEERPRLVSIEVDQDRASPQVRVDHAAFPRGLRRRGRGERLLGEEAKGGGDAPDVLGAPPAGKGEPLLEGHPPVAEVLVGEMHPPVSRPADVGNGGQEPAAGRLPDPGCEYAPGND